MSVTREQAAEWFEKCTLLALLLGRYIGWRRKC